MKISGIDHLVLTTSKLEACLKFYKELCEIQILGHLLGGSHGVNHGGGHDFIQQAGFDFASFLIHLLLTHMNYIDIVNLWCYYNIKTDSVNVIGIT